MKNTHVIIERMFRKGFELAQETERYIIFVKGKRTIKLYLGGFYNGTH